MDDKKESCLTFALLDRKKGLSELPRATGEEYPLPAWYRAVREIPLDELSVEDICKACRQQIHTDYVVPIALRILESDPSAGEMYDGELLVSMKSVPPAYWSDKAASFRLKAIVERTLQLASTTGDIRNDANELLSRITR